MGDLTQHFSAHEFACRDMCGLTTPADALIAGLEILRADLGRPIKILSGLRCAERNAMLGGAKDSQHLTGKAADIVVVGVPLSDIFRAAVGVPEFFSGGIGIYPDGGYVHVDVRGTRARWGYLDRRYVSFGVAWDALVAREA